MRRRLLWIPIIHTLADLGSLEASARKVYIGKFGMGKWRQHSRTVDRMWQAIRAGIGKLEVDYARTRLYQDGLPQCGHEAEIVADLARAGSLNHQLLLELMARGARLTGTESPDLLVEEYELSKQVLAAAERNKRISQTRAQQELGQALLGRRDRAIAQRIDETLQPGETGILFLGMLHSLEGLLAGDIELVHWNPLVPEKQKTVNRQKRRALP